jgi:adenylate kinase family enzyme
MSIAYGQIKIKVEQVSVAGKGAIILTGPSSCGKGEIAMALRQFLDLPSTRHLSMGDILRLTIKNAREDKEFRDKLANVYEIDDKDNIFEDVNSPIKDKALRYESELNSLYPNGVTQLDWLEFCVSHGLLIPDAWTVNIINATFDMNEELKNEIFILDGYPRTVKAAEELLKTFEAFDIPIIKVIHLSITKNEMIRRAMGRKRADDQIESLERRYQFYVESVQPSIDYLKRDIGSNRVAMIDAHQPVFDEGQKFNLKKSIERVTYDVISALGLPKYLLKMDN